MNVTHLMHGKEDDFHMTKSKTACRLTPSDRGVSQYVYTRNSRFVTCEDCREAMERLNTLHGREIYDSSSTLTGSL